MCDSYIGCDKVVPARLRVSPLTKAAQESREAHAASKQRIKPDSDEESQGTGVIVCDLRSRVLTSSAVTDKHHALSAVCCHSCCLCVCVCVSFQLMMLAVSAVRVRVTGRVRRRMDQTMSMTVMRQGSWRQGGETDSHAWHASMVAMCMHSHASFVGPTPRSHNDPCSCDVVRLLPGTRARPHVCVCVCVYVCVRSDTDDDHVDEAKAPKLNAALQNVVRNAST